MTAVKTKKAIIAVNRFGLGASGNELSDARHDPEQWLLQQLVSPVFDKTLADTESAFKTIDDIKTFNKKRSQGEKSGPDVGAVIIKPYRKRLLSDSLSLSIKTDSPFTIRLLDFFSNHFSVTASTQPLSILAPILEREAIGPNLFGQFADILIAVEQHPAMLIYLNNKNSVGPNSQQGKKGRGLNENLAREILELHTLGVNGGYSLEDIRQLAMAISGWSITTANGIGPSGFKFRNASHEPGTRAILGKSYAQIGVAQGEAVMSDLARHEKTAKFMSHKLAQHFIADEPPKELVAAMVSTWVKTEGNIKAVVTTLVEHPQSWNSQALKFKTPREFVVSSYRAFNSPKIIDQNFLNIALRGLNFMGQKPFGAGSPAGYSQLNRAWTGSDALIKRIDWVSQLSNKVREKPQDVARRIFDSRLSPLTVELIRGAESRAQGLAMLLLSPEFLRR